MSVSRGDGRATIGLCWLLTIRYRAAVDLDGLSARLLCHPSNYGEVL